jgi:hypothetical protein
MSQRDDVALLALQKIIDEVASRSYRIREWWYLESHLRKVENSFKPFITTLQRVSTPSEWGAQVSTLTEFWTVCQLMDLPEINSFAQNLEHIHQPVLPGTASYPDPRVGVEALVGAGNGIQQALTAGVLDDLRNQAREFQRSLAGQLANRRTMMQHDVEQLCELTYRLRMQLNG